jgi:hypothetical protein
MANKKGAAGGAAAAGGIQFQSYGAAWLGVKVLTASSKLPWMLPEGTVIRRVECEQEAEVDDVLLRLSDGGTVYLQFKHGLTLGGEFDKAIAQMVQQYHAAGFSGRDRLVIFTDLTASGTVRSVIKNLLDSLREDPGLALAKHLTNEADQKAFLSLRTSVEACWPGGVPLPDENDLRRFLLSVHVSAIDLQAPETVAQHLELLGRVTDREKDVWMRLVDKALTSARKQYGFDRLSLWEMLRRDDIDVSLAAAGSREGSWLRMNELAARMTDAVVSFHATSGFFDPARYVARGVLDLEWRTFCASDARLFVLAGQSGHGKTNALLHYATVHEGVVLLIRGEDLEQDDADLSGSICRLVGGFCSRHGLRPPSEYELRQWLEAGELLLIVDGFDRATLSGPAASRWMSATFAWLGSAKARLALGTRPESWMAGEAPVRMPWLMYRDEQGKAPVPLALFTPEEAQAAALRLGRPDLARYTHPGMMSLAAVLFPGEADSLQHAALIDRYLVFRREEIANLAACTLEEVAIFLGELAASFLCGGSGSLPAAALKALIADSRPIFQAVRKINLLSGDDKLRLHPDEVAEHLQAQQLDIEDALARIGDILDLPIRLGILRSAIVQLEARDPAGAKQAVSQLVERLEKDHPASMRALCVAIALELRDWGGWMGLFTRIARSWDRSNLILSTDPVADLLASPRLAPMDRIALLWEIVWREDGYDWRSKHWLTPEYAPNFRVTRWAVLMQQAMAEAGRDGLAFVMEHFDAEERLGCRESDLGDLAQGLFFRVAATLTSAALDLLTADRRPSARRMTYHICAHYPAASIAWLASGPAMLSDQKAVALLLDIPLDDAVREAYRKLAEAMFVRLGGTALRRDCLRALVRAGDVTAAEELAGLPELDGEEIFALMRTRGAVFSAVSAVLFKRIADGALSSGDFAGIHVSGLPAGQVEEFLGRIAALDAQIPGAISSFSSMLEDMFYELCKGEAMPAALGPVVDALLAHGSKAARRDMIYFSTDGMGRSGMSEAGARFQCALRDRLLAMETSEDNLHVLVEVLIRNETDHAFADASIASLCQRFPQHALMEGKEVFYLMRPGGRLAAAG